MTFVATEDEVLVVRALTSILNGAGVVSKLDHRGLTKLR